MSISYTNTFRFTIVDVFTSGFRSDTTFRKGTGRERVRRTADCVTGAKQDLDRELAANVEKALGVVMTALLWVFFMLYYPPEQKTIPGLRERVQRLYERLGFEELVPGITLYGRATTPTISPAGTDD